MLKLYVCFGCILAANLTFAQPNWKAIKNTIEPFVALPSEFDNPFAQSLCTEGWEDGIEISKDGLNLYCTYVPGDFLSWALLKTNPDKFSPYRRSPSFGMDLVANPIGAQSWVHSDILFSQRTSINASFDTWQLSNFFRPFFSEGAPTPLFNEKLIFTSNDKPPTYDIDIWELPGYPNPTGVGKPLANFPHTTFIEDNPNLTRIDQNNLVLFFDSEDYPNGKGGHDIWYSVSKNNGSTWSTPSNNSSINTISKEHQPHLHRDQSGTWFLYYSAYFNNKLAIFRSKQQIEANWDNWADPELVVGAGNAAGIGEPSLTDDGDLSFVVVIEAPNGNDTNRFDADPWLLPKKRNITKIGETEKNDRFTSLYAQVLDEEIVLFSKENSPFDFRMWNVEGRLVFEQKQCMNGTKIPTLLFQSGLYFLVSESADKVQRLRISIK